MVDLVKVENDVEFANVPKVAVQNLTEEKINRIAHMHVHYMNLSVPPHSGG
jgi:hypothetical protein